MGTSKNLRLRGRAEPLKPPFSV